MFKKNFLFIFLQKKKTVSLIRLYEFRWWSLEMFENESCRINFCYRLVMFRCVVKCVGTLPLNLILFTRTLSTNSFALTTTQLEFDWLLWIWTRLQLILGSIVKLLLFAWYYSVSPCGHFVPRTEYLRL